MADSDVLFTITSAHLDTGLRGFPVGTCLTSDVDPQLGVTYVGYPIADLYDLPPEAVVFLLFKKHLPDDRELAEFKAELQRRMGMPQAALTALGALPESGHPMEWLITGLMLLGMTGKTGNYAEDALNVVAWAPELVAAIFRLRNGWGELIPPDRSKGLVENFVHMMGMPGGDTELLTQILSNFYVLHMDHGGGNLSTFTGRAIASGHADVFASLAGAMAALYGPLHGRANQDCLNFVRSVGSSDPDEVERFVRDSIAKGNVIYGFGHAVLRAEDPRATIQYKLGQELIPNDPLFKTALTLRTVANRVLTELGKVKNPNPNVDAVSGTLLNAVGLTDSNFYTVLFGFSRITGIAAQIVDERTVQRNGRGVAIYRPDYLPVDQPPRRLKAD
ncbi:MAG TPA: citrate/2-methylcitrate synthase, partial [Myxococcota bacterium]|nr:citrate/2-methylcitrate synthase [Myxococcota bacterium]